MFATRIHKAIFLVRRQKKLHNLLNPYPMEKECTANRERENEKERETKRTWVQSESGTERQRSRDGIRELKFLNNEIIIFKRRIFCTNSIPPKHTAHREPDRAEECDGMRGGSQENRLAFNSALTEVQLFKNSSNLILVGRVEISWIIFRIFFFSIKRVYLFWKCNQFYLHGKFVQTGTRWRVSDVHSMLCAPITIEFESHVTFIYNLRTTSIRRGEAEPHRVVVTSAPRILYSMFSDKLTRCRKARTSHMPIPTRPDPFSLFTTLATIANTNKPTG